MLSLTGKFGGWKAVAFELGFEPGYEERADWLLSPAAKDKLDSLCQAVAQSVAARLKRSNARLDFSAMPSFVTVIAPVSLATSKRTGVSL